MSSEPTSLYTDTSSTAGRAYTIMWLALTLYRLLTVSAGDIARAWIVNLKIYLGIAMPKRCRWVLEGTVVDTGSGFVKSCCWILFKYRRWLTCLAVGGSDDLLAIEWPAELSNWLLSDKLEGVGWPAWLLSDQVGVVWPVWPWVTNCWVTNWGGGWHLFDYELRGDHLSDQLNGEADMYDYELRRGSSDLFDCWVTNLGFGWPVWLLSDQLRNYLTAKF